MRAAAGASAVLVVFSVAACGHEDAAPVRSPREPAATAPATGPPPTVPVTSPPGTNLDPPLGNAGVTPGVTGVPDTGPRPPVSYATPEELKTLGIDPSAFQLLRPDGMGAMQFGDGQSAVLGVLAEAGAGILRRRTGTCDGGSFQVLEWDDLLTAFDLSRPDTPLVGYRFRQNRGGPAPLTTAGGIHLGSTVAEARAAFGPALTLVDAAPVPDSPEPVRAAARAIGTVAVKPTTNAPAGEAPSVRLLLSANGDADQVTAVEAGRTCAFDAPA